MQILQTFIYIEFFYIVKLFLIIRFCMGLVYLILINITVKNYTNVKHISYECGFMPFQSRLTAVNINFFIIRFFFLLFDIELIFLLPIIFSLSSLSLYGFFSLQGFIFILLCIYICELFSNRLKF